MTDELRKAIELLQAAAAKQDGGAPAPTIDELWAGWTPLHAAIADRPGARVKMPSWRVAATQAKALLKTPLPFHDGREVSLGELRWHECTPTAAELYRQVRETHPSAKGGTIKPNTVSRELVAMQSMLTWHKERGTIDRNPLTGMSKPSERQFARRGYLLDDDFYRFLEHAHPLLRDMAVVSFRAFGMRNSEVRLLQKSEINWNLRIIDLSHRRTKTREERVIPIVDEVEEILERHCRNSLGPYVFVTPSCPRRTTPVPRETLRTWIWKARKLSGMHSVAGEPVTFHHFRHSSATELVIKNANPEAARRALGMSPETFSHYAKIGSAALEQLRQLVERPVSEFVPAAERRGPQRSSHTGVVPPHTKASAFVKK